jgi:hypothetical protein
VYRARGSGRKEPRFYVHWPVHVDYVQPEKAMADCLDSSFPDPDLCLGQKTISGGQHPSERRDDANPHVRYRGPLFHSCRLDNLHRDDRIRPDQLYAMSQTSSRQCKASDLLLRISDTGLVAFVNKEGRVTAVRSAESMSLGVDNGKIRTPGTDGLRVLLCHRLDDLTDVIEIVNYPRGEELVKSHFSKVGMNTAFTKVLR